MGRNEKSNFGSTMVALVATAAHRDLLPMNLNCTPKTRSPRQFTSQNSKKNTKTGREKIRNNEVLVYFQTSWASQPMGCLSVYRNDNHIRIKLLIRIHENTNSIRIKYSTRSITVNYSNRALPNYTVNTEPPDQPT